jgi:pilus assembly protein CpaE
MTILCEPDQEVAGALAAFIAGDLRTVTTLAAVAEALAADPDETVLILGAGVDPEQALPFAARLRVDAPDVGVILLSGSLDFRLLARAATAGVREVLPASDGEALADACRRARHLAPDRTVPESRAAGRIITVFAAKGGCGKTTFATNLAVVLNAGGARRVCLLDLDLAFGDVASTLRLYPGRSLIDAVEMDRKVDVAAVSALVTSFRPGLDCILAPVGPGEAEKVPPGLVGDLLAVLPSMYDFVVVDTPAQLSSHVLAALDAADHHVLLSTPEIPTLKNLRRTLDVLDMLSYSRQSRSVVFNRSDTRIELMVADIEEAVRSPVAAHVPSSPDVPVSVNRGVPLAAERPDHPVSRAIREFAETRLAPAGRDPPRIRFT